MDVREMPLPDLVAACSAETTKYLSGEPSLTVFCWELFRRAVCERNHDAWAALFDKYRRLVIAWLRQHPVAARLEADDDYWVTAAFERFFISVGPERFDIFADLGQILRYLKMCVNSAVMDDARSRGRTQHEEVSEQEPDRSAERSDPQSIVVDRQDQEKLWRAVLDACKSEHERVVAVYCWKLGFKPAELQARRLDLFPNVKEVYTTLRNLKDRLKRNPDIQRYLD
jgi:hypothetical protein